MSVLPSDTEAYLEDHLSTTEGQSEEHGTKELPDNQTNAQSLKEKLANMYRFTSDMDLRRMPISTFDTAMSCRSALALHVKRSHSTEKVKQTFQTNSIVSIHSGDTLIRVVLTESLPFMCSLCGEAFTHTKPLQDHAEEKHGYFQNLVDENQTRKKPIIIVKDFGKKREKKCAPKKDFEEDRDPPDDHGIAIDQNDSLENDAIDDSISEVPSDAELEKDGAEKEAMETNPSNKGDSAELISTQVANQAEVPTEKRAHKRNADESDTIVASVPSKTTSINLQDGVKKQKKQKKSREEKYTIVHADHIVQKKSGNTRKKSRLDENDEPRMVKTLKPYCVVCHLHCITRVYCRAHLAEAHKIFPNRKDAEKALKEMNEKEKEGQVNGLAENRNQQEQSKSSPDDAQNDIIKCNFCESYVFTNNTLEKHMRAHCGLRGIKCDICQEGIRLWKNSMMEELKDLSERCLSKDRRPQDVDCDAGKQVPKYPNSRVISTCYECGELFYFRSHMSHHYAKAHERITCKDCSVSVPTMGALAKHSLKNHKPGVFRCQWCPRHFHDLGKYNYHLQGHMGVYRCPGCGRNFLEKPSLTSHMEKYAKCPEHFQGRQTTAQEISVEKPYVFDGIIDYQSKTTIACVCNLCNAEFFNKGNYTRHMNTVHPGHEGAASSENTFMCDTCGNIFWSKPTLTAHMKIHNKKFLCTFQGCTRKFWSQGKLNKHEHSHENAPTVYPCEDCGKSFKQTGSLRFHKLTHGEHKSSCDICQKDFKGLTNLFNHMQEVHKRELNFTCDVCEKRFASRRRLRSHAKIHSDRQKNFACEKCTYATTEKRFLAQHQRVHNKPHPCNFCHKSFNQPKSLKGHHLKDHGIQEHIASENDENVSVIEEIKIDMSDLAPENEENVNAVEEMKIEVSDLENVGNLEDVVIVEYPSDNLEAAEAANRAIAALVSELQG